MILIFYLTCKDICNNYNNILNEKIAPIMCHWLGYPGTMGIPTIDYIFADQLLYQKNRIFYRKRLLIFLLLS